jgi:Glycosyl transferase family 2
MHVAIVTMVYNERVNLPIWIRHYTRHCPGATLFVIDHGSDDGSSQGLSGVHLVPVPRTPFDDQTRTELVADFQHALLRLYDVVIYTDCDEMLVADPRLHASLASFLAGTNSDVIAPIGLNVHHLLGFEPPIDLSAPNLGPAALRPVRLEHVQAIHRAGTAAVGARFSLVRPDSGLPHRPLPVPSKMDGHRRIAGALAADPQYAVVRARATPQLGAKTASKRRGACRGGVRSSGQASRGPRGGALQIRRGNETSFR